MASTIGSFGVLVVYSEGHFPVERLQEMLVARIDDPRVVPELLKCVFVENISDPCLFWRFLIEKLPKIMTTVKVRPIFYKQMKNSPNLIFYRSSFWWSTP